jgi:ATP-dependent protease ClpP protease subunit
MHDGSSAVWNSSAKALDQMEFNRKLENRIKEYIIERSNLTEKEYDEKLRVEWYLFAEEAKEKGFTDCIIGVDCGLDDVI